jgi:hypothetical protein
MAKVVGRLSVGRKGAFLRSSKLAASCLVVGCFIVAGFVVPTYARAAETMATHATATTVSQGQVSTAGVVNAASPMPIQAYLHAVLQDSPDVQLAYAKVREARVRQQDVIKKRFLNLFNFVNAENLQGSAQSDVQATEAQAEADVQQVLLEAGLNALNLAKTHLDLWAQVDELVLLQKQHLAVQYQFKAGKATRYQVDAAHAEWLVKQQLFRQTSQQVNEQLLRMQATITDANQLQHHHAWQLALPDLYQTKAALVWAPFTDETGVETDKAKANNTDNADNCLSAIKSAIDARPEMAAFSFRKRSLAKLIKASKLSERPVLMSAQHQLMLKQQKFERSVVVAINSVCDAQQNSMHALPTLAMAAQQAFENDQQAHHDYLQGRLSELDWLTVHHQWTLAHQAWRTAELNQAVQLWRLRYYSGHLNSSAFFSPVDKK